jgi:CheY-like chemotaxis protein
MKMMRFLVVDDGPDLRSWATVLERRFNAHVTTASTLEETVDRLMRETYDVVVSDAYEWGDTSGRAYESVLRAVKTSSSNLTPVIFMSRLAPREDVFQIGKLGAFDFLFVDTRYSVTDGAESLIASVEAALAMRRLPRVFVSYSSTDRAFAEQLTSQLKDRGLRVWYDGWEIVAGDSIVQKVQEGLSSSDCLIVVLSPASVASRWVREELSVALMRQLSGQDIFVIPVLKEECDIPPLLRSRKYVDYRTHPEARLNELELAIRARTHHLTRDEANGS